MTKQYLATFYDRHSHDDSKLVVLSAENEDEAKDLASEIAQITSMRSGTVTQIGKSKDASSKE